MHRSADVPTVTTSGTKALSAQRVGAFRRRLLEWGVEHRRDFPWRHTRDPWAILVSEVMLQQTQAERVVPYYLAFLSAFPTPSACAAASSADVVRLWSGLGYNRRALSLHRAARLVESEHGGQLPDDDAALRALPGVGAYTARAVRSFGFGAPVAAVDTNAVRVLTRCLEGGGLSVRAVEAMGDRLVGGGDSWTFNQAMFDLGATVCRGRPDCVRCPMSTLCRWRRAGLEAPDPWRASPSVRPQSAFAGSDRQGRGRLVNALRQGPVRRDSVAEACGWPDDVGRSERIAAALVTEGFAQWLAGPPERLELA
jgi:A/G-specific adenine glycosylase